ncbi:MAG: hypothetical protein ACOCX2_08405 [Armatimonadota bacterium]
MLGAFAGALLTALVLASMLLLIVWAVFRIFGMWVQDKLLNFPEFLVILLVIFGLMGTAAATRSAVGLGAFILLFLLLVFIPFIPRVADAVKRRQMLLSDIRGYQAALKHNPEVPYPHRKLGDIYASHEDWDRAIEHYSAYVNMVEAKPDVRHRLQRVLQARRRRDMGLRVCPSCGAENPRNFVRCQECGFYLQGLREFADVLTTPDMMLRWKLLIVVFFVPGLLIGLMPEVIPPVITLLLLSVSVIATVVFLWGTARRERAQILHDAIVSGQRAREHVIDMIPEPPEVRSLDENVGER